MSRHSNLPNILYVYVENKFLDKSEGLTEAIWHGVFAREGEVLLTHLLLETGAHWTGVPLHGIHHKPNFIPKKSGVLQPWGNMGVNLDLTSLNHLEGIDVNYFKENLNGLSTGILVDWHDGFSKFPQQHKPLHLITMEDGNYYLLPNNYLRWNDPSFTNEKLWEKCKNYKRGTEVWFPENKINK